MKSKGTIVKLLLVTGILGLAGISGSASAGTNYCENDPTDIWTGIVGADLTGNTGVCVGDFSFFVEEPVVVSICENLICDRYGVSNVRQRPGTPTCIDYDLWEGGTTSTPHDLGVDC